MVAYEVCLIEKELAERGNPYGNPSSRNDRYKYIATLFAPDIPIAIAETPVFQISEAEKFLRMFIGSLTHEGWEPMPLRTFSGSSGHTELVWYFKRPIP